MFVYISVREERVIDAHDIKRVMLLYVSVQSWHMQNSTGFLNKANFNYHRLTKPKA